jgi:NADH:ubiquinone oxidoreductase subunit C
MKIEIMSLNNFRNQMEKLKDARLITISAIDSGENFQLYYHFDLNGIKTFKVTISDKTPIIKSITDIFPSAEFYEREIHDFFGIEFEGNPHLHEKMFLPSDWDKLPPHKKTNSEINA